MARLIDATRIEQYILNNCSDNEEINAIYAEIVDAPTVDAFEVVRCKDCEWRNCLRCYHKRSGMDDLVGENDYCSWGKRREDVR